MTLDKTITAHAIRLKAQAPEIPDERAQAKAEHTVYGKLLFVVGVALLLAGGAYGFLLVLKGQPLTFVAATFAAGPAVVGVVAVTLGANLMSRDLAPALAKLGELVVSILKARKGAA